VLQRVSRASVAIDGQTVARIHQGYLALVGFTAGDDQSAAEWMADKVVGLRLFPDATGRMNLALGDVGGAVLAVSQFTLYADATKGRRPSFISAAPPDQAEPLYEHFVAALRQRGIEVETGRFGALMAVDLVNDGPVTLILER
jgi:D-tyrosyl-tRNA(Tyr) deacylase